MVFGHKHDTNSLYNMNWIYSQRKFKGKAMHVAVATVAGTLTNTIGSFI